jgi:hypothetical protein
MGCIAVVLAWLSPRLLIGLLYIFTERLTVAFNSGWIGILGFLFLPYTTAFYALAYAPIHGVTGIGWILVVLGVLFDLGSHVAGGRSAYRR